VSTLDSGGNGGAAGRAYEGSPPAISLVNQGRQRKGPRRENSL
jgi:hypothetical protein